MNFKEETVYSNVETANSKQLAILKKNFPNCFDLDGNFIQERMLEIVKENNIELSKESYSVNWLGKSYSRLLANLPPKTLIHEDVEHNSQEQHKNSKNLLIKGDNLEVLKHLINAYSEKVKMIYIDPPYNTGSDGFVYNDDRKFSKEQLSELAGLDLEEAERILSFADKGSNTHSAWLTFMYPRLYIARELLKEDGIIFISIDDNELSQLKLVCDEIFGESNFIGVISRSTGTRMGSGSRGIARELDYIIIYAKSDIASLNKLPITAEQLVIYNEEDENGKYLLRSLRRTGGENRREDRPSMFFPVINPDGEKDLEQLETELTIKFFEDGHSGKGYYFWMTEYPEEGAMKLDIESGAEG
jgi:adenine-specific DNA-methyltransferase